MPASATREVQQAYVGYVYGDSTCGQRALYEVGLTGVPIVNVNNNCSTGSTALFLARQAIEAGADCVLALGFEQMKPGALGAVFTDRPTPFDRFDAVTEELVGESQIPLALRYFGGAGPRAHAALRHAAGNVRTDPRQGEPPCGEQSARTVPQTGHRRAGAGRRAGLAGRDDAADGVPADLRRGRRVAGVAKSTRAATASTRRCASSRRR